MMRKASELSSAYLQADKVSIVPVKRPGDPPASATLFAIAMAIIPAVVLLVVLASLFSQLDIEIALRSGFGKWAQLN